MVRRVAVLLALALTSVGCNLQTNPLVVRLFGPPGHTLTEAYAASNGTQGFDHSVFDGLLSRHVRGVQVDYAALHTEEAVLDGYIEALSQAPFDSLSRDEKLALLINAYNAYTLKLILDHYPVDSIQDIPAKDRWDAERWTLGGRTLSLTQIEHDELRAKFIEPRIHFAINCASVGCPPLRPEAYTADRLEAQLLEQSQQVHNDDTWLRIDGTTVHLTRLYLWYAGDFEQVSGDVLSFAAQFRPELAEGDFSVRWMDYDWSLNDVSP